MDWHSPEVVLMIGTAWSGAMLGAIKYLFTRNMESLDERLEIIGDLERRMGDQERQVAAVEACLRNPQNCQQHAESLLSTRALHSRIDTVAQSMNRVDGRLEGIGRAVDLMNEFLINRGDK